MKAIESIAETKRKENIETMKREIYITAMATALSAATNNQDFINSCEKAATGYYRPIKKHKGFIVVQSLTRLDYMKNCIFWLEEYSAGRAPVEKAKTALLTLERYCDQIFIEITKTT